MRSADNLNHLHVPIVLKSGSLALLERSLPAQCCTGFALPSDNFERGVESNILKVFAAVVSMSILDLILLSNVTHRNTSQTFRPYRVRYPDDNRFVAKYVTCFRTDLSRHTYVLHGAILLEKLTVSQLVKKFPAFHGTRKFITAFTGARHLSLP